MKTLIVGSNYFFKGLDGFKSKDIDRLVLVDNPVGFSYMRQTSSSHNCLFEIARLPKDVLIAKALNTKAPMMLNRFLIPEFCEEIGFTIEDLPKLQPLCERMDDKHKYLNVIYDAYIANNSYMLTDEQRLAAYEEYKRARNKENN